MTLLLPSIMAIVIFALLDLSAAFHTVDHRILLKRLSTGFGICNKALDWFVSYLSDRTQFVKVNVTSSHLSHLTQGVPQGSVSGPILFFYTLLPWAVLPSDLISIAISMWTIHIFTYLLKHNFKD